MIKEFNYYWNKLKNFWKKKGIFNKWLVIGVSEVILQTLSLPFLPTMIHLYHVLFWVLFTIISYYLYIEYERRRGN